jgi:hypothetical protein
MVQQVLHRVGPYFYWGEPMLEVNLDKEKFREWLESKPEGEVIGRVQSCAECPIAQYLNNQFQLENYDWWIVTCESYYPHSTNSWDHMVPLPNWAKDFIGEIDSLVRTIDGQVTKEYCLNTLSIL